MIEKFFLAFIPVFVAIDPIGLVAIFLGLSTSASGEQRKRQALLGIFTALGIAIGFIFLGKIIFAALGITVADFQVAGGLILLGLAGRELLSLGPQDRGGGDEFGECGLGGQLWERTQAAGDDGGVWSRLVARKPFSKDRQVVDEQLTDGATQSCFDFRTAEPIEQIRRLGECTQEAK